MKREDDERWRRGNIQFGIIALIAMSKNWHESILLRLPRVSESAPAMQRRQRGISS